MSPLADLSSRVTRLLAGVRGTAPTLADPAAGGSAALLVGGGVAATAAIGTWATYPRLGWYDTLRQPAIKPPAAAFPTVWSLLYAAIWASSSATIHDLRKQGQHERADAYMVALATNLVLNAGWSIVFFRAQRLKTASVVAGVLAASAADLARRASPTGTGRAVALGAYAAWCSFATVLSARTAQLNPRRGRPQT